MTFPDSPRVLFRKRPLDEVICQIRFPPILRIEAEAPSNFQDRIRHDYPNYSKQVHTPPIPQELMPLVGVLGVSTSVLHQFADEEHDWTATMSKDFVALTAKDYADWKTFEARLVTLVDTFTDVYQPSYFTRVGLQYCVRQRHSSQRIAARRRTMVRIASAFRARRAL